LKKKVIAILIALIFSIQSMPQGMFWMNHSVTAAGSTEIPEGYIGIFTAEDLNNVRNHLTGKYILMNDIDLSGQEWIPIGTPAQPFSGTFDGNGFVIKGLNINLVSESKVYIGLFGYGVNMLIKNLGVTGSQISITGGKVKEPAYSGGIAGYLSNSTVINSFSDIRLQSQALKHVYSAGIAGYATNSEINNSYNLGDVQFDFSGERYSYLGGIVGLADESLFSEVYNSGTISGNYYSGGIAGQVHESRIVNAFNLGTVSTRAYYQSTSGGIAGKAILHSEINNTYNIGGVLADTWNEPEKRIGGIVGTLDSTTVTNSYYYDQEGTIPSRTNYGTVKSKVEMQQQTTYAGFDFNDVWDMGGSEGFMYPILKKTPLSAGEKVVSLSMKSNPAKTTYPQGEELDITGAVLQVNTNYLNEYDVEVTNEMVSEYDKNKPGEQTVYVTYDTMTIAFSVIVIADTTPPEQPVVADFTDHENLVTGTTKPGSAVIVTISGSQVGSTIANEDGKFSIYISRQPAGTTIEVASKDKYGNSSTPAKIVVKPKLQGLIGETRYATAVKVSQTGWKTADTVFLVNGFAIVDGLTATPLASAKDAPILLTAADSIPKPTMDEIIRLKAKAIILIGGDGVITPKVANELVAKGFKVTRIGGLNRKDTSLSIAKELDKLVDVSTIHVAYGWGEPDALSIAAQAGLKKQPIILADKTSVPADTLGWLKTESLADAYFIGGDGVVAPSIISTIDKIASGDVSKNRISGLNRHETNAKVISKFYPEAQLASILVAKSETASLVDALAAGPLAAKLGSPVLLISSYVGLLPEQKQVLAGKNSKYVHQIGGGVNAAAVGEVVK
jgi:putative cell wall-binding protein